MIRFHCSSCFHISSSYYYYLTGWGGGGGGEGVGSGRGGGERWGFFSSYFLSSMEIKMIRSFKVGTSYSQSFDISNVFCTHEIRTFDSDDRTINRLFLK